MKRKREYWKKTYIKVAKKEKKEEEKKEEEKEEEEKEEKKPDPFAKQDLERMGELPKVCSWAVGGYAKEEVPIVVKGANLCRVLWILECLKLNTMANLFSGRT